MQPYRRQKKVRKKSSTRKMYFIVIIAIILFVSGWVFYSVTKDPWYCQDGKWITDKVTDKPMPDEVCPKEADREVSNDKPKPEQKYIDMDSQKNAEGIDIRVFEPHVNATINSPLSVTGEAMNWYFENGFDVVLMDANGNVLVKDVARAVDDVVDDTYVRFETELTFDVEEGVDRGNIVFQKSEAMNEDGSFSFPVFFR